jgi:hypothetical protein
MLPGSGPPKDAVALGSSRRVARQTANRSWPDRSGSKSTTYEGETMREFSFAELTLESVELLPDRDTLAVWNSSSVTVTQSITDVVNVGGDTYNTSTVDVSQSISGVVNAE